MKRYYCDYNATAPLCNKVIDWLQSGEYPWGNPSAVNSTGRAAKKVISDVSSFLFEKFSLKNNFELFYHSGATEGINTIVKGLADYLHCEKGEKLYFIYSGIDHSCVCNLALYLKSKGHETYEIPIDRHGEFSVEDLIEHIKEVQSRGQKRILMNYTVVNNETGIFWPFSWLEKIKSETGILMHVDAAQLIGKVEDYLNIPSILDAITFSGHKFGALKGIGFTFIKESFDFLPLLIGGGQQKGLRSGTMNVMGAYSMQLALENIMEEAKLAETRQNTLLIEKALQDYWQDQGEIIGQGAQKRSVNTIAFILKNYHSDFLLAAFDMHKVDVSAGSACSSGLLKPNRVLGVMGYSEEECKGVVRLSFSIFMKENQAKEYAQKIVDVLKSVKK